MVVDPTINEDVMEMYADQESRGGVLEPEGIVGIKFRRDRILSTMERLDPLYGRLKSQLSNKSLSDDELASLKVQLADREKVLTPVYTQISLQFADLHDRSGRMEAKGVIRQSLQWKDARRFFYWRLRRKLNEKYLVRRLTDRNSKLRMSMSEVYSHLQRWYADLGKEKDLDNDQEIATWLEREGKKVQEKIEIIRNDAITEDVLNTAASNKAALMNGLKKILKKLTEEEKQNVIEQLMAP